MRHTSAPAARPGSVPATIRLPIVLAGLCALGGCSTLKMSNLHDARILDNGAMAVSAQLATAANLERMVVVSAEGDSLMDLVRTHGDQNRHADAGGIPLVGANFARGLGHGLEFNVGADLAVFGLGCIMLDAGLKKRLYGNPRFLLTAYGRIAIGSAPKNTLIWSDTAQGQETFYHLEAQTFEVDAQLLSLVRIFPRLSFYFNAGPTAGNAGYELDANTEKIPWEGDVGFFGAKTHMGLVLETRRFEIAGELGSHFMSYGYVPSLGLRAAVKTDWLR